MRLTELLLKQKIIVQLMWGEQKIEFFSEVLEKDDSSVYITPYIHSNNVLQLNITVDKGVICNIYTDEPGTNKRISWKAIELTTVDRNNKTVYCLKTRGYNNFANPDDRRLHARVLVDVNAIAHDEQSGAEENIIIRDISDTGISFYAPESFIPKSQQLEISFSDKIDDRIFDVKIDCSISRINKDNDKNIIGCRVLGENKNYLIYQLIKRLKSKNQDNIDDTNN